MTTTTTAAATTDTVYSNLGIDIGHHPAGDRFIPPGSRPFVPVVT